MSISPHACILIAYYSSHTLFIPLQLFGMDVLLDTQLRAWLLEVNTTPSLAADLELDMQIKTAVVTDLM